MVGRFAVSLAAMLCSHRPMLRRIAVCAALASGAIASGCAVVSVAGAVVGVAATVVETAVDVTGTAVKATASVVGGAVGAVTSSSDEPKKKD